MSKRSLFFIFLLCALSDAFLFAQAGTTAVWEYNFAGSVLPGKNTTSSSPETNHSGGIALWDQSHVLIYSLVSTGQLAIRKPHDANQNEWSFLLQIICIDTGKVDHSATIPAESSSSQLALTSAGIVVSNPGHLIFYSRTFQQLKSDFVYTPLSEHLEREIPHLARRLAGLVYVTPSQQYIVIVDPDGHRSRIYVFDGVTFQNTISGLLNEIDPHSVSIGDRGFFYTDMNYHDRVFFSNFDGVAAEWKGFFYQKNHAHEPIYIATDEWLDVLHTITLVNDKESKTLYQERNTEGVLGPAAISPDKTLAAVLKDNVRTGGTFNRDLHRTGVEVLLVSLKTEGKTCAIPITPPPQNILAMKFGGDSKLIVLHDYTVSAYEVPCVK